MEIWDIYNENREKTGKTIVRGQPLVEGEYHLVVHIWIINSHGEFLIQKRASTVSSSPNMWATTGGAAITGEDSHMACQREVLEEIGIEVKMDLAEVALTITRNNSIADIWVIRQDIEIKDCRLQEAEVSEVKWATLEEIKEMQDQGEFHRYQYFEDLIDNLGILKVRK